MMRFLARLGRHRPTVWAVVVDDRCHRFGFAEQQLIDHLRSFGYGMHIYVLERNTIYSDATRDARLNLLFIAADQVDEVAARLAKSTNPFA
jgi:hypothetical protein